MSKYEYSICCHYYYCTMEKFACSDTRIVEIRTKHVCFPQMCSSRDRVRVCVRVMRCRWLLWCHPTHTFIHRSFPHVCVCWYVLSFFTYRHHHCCGDIGVPGGGVDGCQKCDVLEASVAPYQEENGRLLTQVNKLHMANLRLREQNEKHDKGKWMDLSMYKFSFILIAINGNCITLKPINVYVKIFMYLYINECIYICNPNV